MSADAGTLTTKSFLAWFVVTCSIPSLLKGDLSNASFLAFELLISSDPSSPTGLTITTAYVLVCSANIELLALTLFCHSLWRAACAALFLSAFDVTRVYGSWSLGTPLTSSSSKMAVSEAVAPPSKPSVFCLLSGRSPIFPAIEVNIYDSLYRLLFGVALLSVFALSL